MAQFDDDPDDTYIDPAAALATLMALGAIADQWNSIRTARDRGLPQHLADEMERGFIEVAEAYLGVTSVAVDIAPPTGVRTVHDARYRPIPGDTYTFDTGGGIEVIEVLGDAVRVANTFGNTYEVPLDEWADDDGDGTWVPA